MQGLRSLAALAALALALLLWADDADAWFESQSSAGRGAERSAMSPPIAALAPFVLAADHVAGTAPNPGSLVGLFNRPGLLAGFAAGFLGSGLLGVMFGHGLVGELGSVASFLGLIFQLALIALLGRIIWIWWSGRNAPAFAGLSPRQLADPYLRSRNDLLAVGDILPGDDAAVDDGQPANAKTPSEVKG